MRGEELRVQAALRRVATLVARGVAQEEVFAAVTEEVGQLLAVGFAIMGRFEADGTVTCVASWGAPAGRSPVPIGVVGRRSGFHSAVGTPIHVEGRVWGVMTVGTTREEPPLPAGTDARLEQFTELLATAVANAESRARLARLAEEQAALGRVATLVAAGAPPQEVFAAVVEEVGQLLPVDLANMCRYEPDRAQTFVATWGRPGKRFPEGSRWPLGGKNIGTIVFETGRPARIDDYSDSDGPVSLVAREPGLRSAVGTPIIVESRLWGMIGVGSTLEQPLPPDTEARLASFTELVATAVANAESRAELARLAEQQAALRRVATLVALGTPPEEVFAAVVDEVGRATSGRVGEHGPLRAGRFAELRRHLGQRVEPFALGSRQKLGGNNLGTIVFETGRPARFDGYAETSSGPLGVGVREAGIRSSVATPIMVEGRLGV